MDDGLRDRIRALPKIELHRHLEGSVRLATLVDIARTHDMDLDVPTAISLRPLVQMVDGDERSAQGFLSKFKVLREFFRSQDIIRRIAYEAVVDAAEDNVRYMELRFTPKALCAISNCTPDEATIAVCEAANAAALEYGITVRYIVSMNRHESLELGFQALESALAHQDMGIVGLDLAGAEAGFPASLFRDVFVQAHEAGLGITIHAGEWAGAESIRDALDNMHVDRIGHGINAIQDTDIVRELAECGIVLEVCPMSNVLSGVVPTLDQHPLPQLTQAGIVTTINTDDPAVCDVTLTDEIAYAVENGLMQEADIADYTLRAAQAAFLPPSERDQLVAAFKGWYQEVE